MTSKDSDVSTRSFGKEQKYWLAILAGLVLVQAYYAGFHNQFVWAFPRFPSFFGNLVVTFPGVLAATILYLLIRRKDK